jgi:hypothetical protein
MNKKENYKMIRDLLGTNDPQDKILWFTIKLKNKSDIVIANKVWKGIEFKLSKRFLGRVTKEKKLSMISAIEPDKDFLNYHIHAVLKLKELQSRFNDQEIVNQVKLIISRFNEINSKDPNWFDYEITSFSNEDHIKNISNYMVKTSSRSYDPLLRFTNKQQPVTQL